MQMLLTSLAPALGRQGAQHPAWAEPPQGLNTNIKENTKCRRFVIVSTAFKV
jgi:hypothetical protein